MCFSSGVTVDFWLDYQGVKVIYRTKDLEEQQARRFVVLKF